MKVRFLYITTFLACALFALSGYSQFNAGGNYWKKFRTEYYGAIGATSFLGELGGRNEIGSDFVYDFELNQTRWCVNAGIRHYVKRNISVRGNLVYGMLAGDDAQTKEPFRMKRNLHFRSMFTELSGLVEYNYRKGSVGNQYSISGSNRGIRSFRETIYSVFAGVGVMRFNPRAKFNDQWVELKPLGTEGQNFGDGASSYSNFTLLVPVGFAVRRAVSRRLNVSLELAHRITFTDYIDDVSTVYYDNEAIFNDAGFIGSYLADPSFDVLERDGELIPLDNTQPGMQRGDDSDFDSYMTLTLGANYKLKTYNYKRKRRNKSKRKKGQRLVF